MDNFISLSDYDASIHRDILDALLRKDTTAIQYLLEWASVHVKEMT